MSDKALRVYGRWAGNPKGVLEDVTLCVEEVADRGSFHFHQCTRRRGHGPDGLYCRQHDPSEVAKRQAAADLRYEKEREKLLAPSRAMRALALAGITPAALAADPECVRKLVEAARHYTKDYAVVDIVEPRFDPRIGEARDEPTGDTICAGCGESDDHHSGVCGEIRAALRACGIEEGP